MYGINRVGADGELLTLIGSQNTRFGRQLDGAAGMMNPAARPTKVDRASDVTGLVDTGELGTLFSNPDDAIAVLESMTRLSASPRPTSAQTKLAAQPPKPSAAQAGALRLREVDLSRRPLPHARPRSIRTSIRTSSRRRAAAASAIFTAAEYNADGEFRKTAAIMKMVINGYAGAGTVTMGGYDYHGQGRNTGETRNFRAGRCIGACLEYAARKQQAAHDLRVQRRLAVGERRGRTTPSTAAASSTGRATTSRPRLVRAGLQARRGRVRPCAAATRMQIGSFSAAGAVDDTSQPRRPTRSTCWSRP